MRKTFVNYYKNIVFSIDNRYLEADVINSSILEALTNEIKYVYGTYVFMDKITENDKTLLIKTLTKRIDELTASSNVLNDIITKDETVGGVVRTNEQGDIIISNPVGSVKKEKANIDATITNLENDIKTINAANVGTEVNDLYKRLTPLGRKYLTTYDKDVKKENALQSLAAFLNIEKNEIDTTISSIKQPFVIKRSMSEKNIPIPEDKKEEKKDIDIDKEEFKEDEPKKIKPSPKRKRKDMLDALRDNTLTSRDIEDIKSRSKKKRRKRKRRKRRKRKRRKMRKIKLKLKCLK